ncbi:MAG: tetratricopeptide repeat protein [Asgard group archaeon]|nr:tetratricopeptide repeat protein [Asgard group archaeon]
MSSTVEKQLAKIDQLLIHGEFKVALAEIAKGLKTNDIKIEENLAFLVHKCDIQNELGKHLDALKLAEKVLKESEKLDNNLLQVDALIQKAYALYYSTGDFSEGLECVEKGLDLLEKISNLDQKESDIRKSMLLYWKGLIFYQLGDLDKNIEYLKESVTFAEKSGNKRILARCLSLTGFFLRDKGGYEEYFDRAYKIATEIGNKLELAAYCVTHAYILGKNKQFNESFELYEKGFSLLDEIGSTVYHHAYNDLGLIYRANYQLDKALECFKKSMSGFDWGNHVVINNIALTYFMKYDLKKAQEYYLKSLAISEEVKDRRALPNVLFNLVLISLELKNLSKAQKYLNRLKEISVETGYARIDKLYRYASTFILKASNDFGDWGQAEELLQELLVEKDILPDWRLDILYNLLELRIKELQLSPSEETLNKVQKYITKLEKKSEELKLRWLLANVYRLQSQLALVELDVVKAVEFLAKAKVIAEEIDVEILNKSIIKDQNKINQQLAMLKKFQKRHATISETVKLVSLDSTIGDIKEKTALEERDKDTGEVIEYRKLFVIKI